ncbi:MAG: alcohol dehydrogenase catalytic domain-containing protein, partial [Caldilineaceae bacterium]|nr:alcohol dehydrogenase catalytic domain-containing protein [Caldilineaceae bacterium]
MPTKARGAIARTPGAPLSIEEFTIGDPGPNEVLVRILASGVCHTDLGVKMGVYGSEGYPFLMGHEGAGVIEAVGPGVTKHKVGDHVILAWRAPCGECRFCRKGKPSFCAASLNAEKRMTTHDGLTLNPVLGIGTFCTHTLVHADQAVGYDPALPAPQMSLIGCGVMTGVGAALYAAGVSPGSSAAVFGCGGVGNSVIAGAKLGGATTIIAVDIDPKKLEWAKDFGATHTVNAAEVDPVVKIKEITGGHGANFTFEAVGKAQTLDQALWSRDLAGTCVLIGVPGPGPEL